MEASVRYIPTHQVIVDGRDMSVGSKPALCFRGLKYAIGIINDDETIHPVMLTLRDHDKSRLVMAPGGAEEYPVYRFITHITRISERKPIDGEALRLIQQWPNNPEDFGDPVVEETTPSPVTKPKKAKQPNCIACIAEEMGLTPTKIRKFLRGQGFTAPYENETKIRTALKSFK